MRISTSDLFYTENSLKVYRGLLETLVDPADVRRYQLPWCGRFSVPFGMELVRRTAERLGGPVPEGAVLATGTSLSDPRLAVSEATLAAGLGTTAPSNLQAVQAFRVADHDDARRIHDPFLLYLQEV